MEFDSETLHYACTFLKHWACVQEMLITGVETMEQETVNNHPRAKVCRFVVQVLVIPMFSMTTSGYQSTMLLVSLVIFIYNI
jgi:hypothetical protein